MLKALKLKLEADLLGITVLSAALILAIIFVPDSPLRSVLGIPFVLFFPGYTLISTLFPGRKGLDGTERLALSIGLSLAVVPLLGLVLNFTPFGICLYPILLALFLFTLSMSLASMYRRKNLPPEERRPLPRAVNVPRWSELSRENKILSVGGLMCIVVGGGLTAHFASMPRMGEAFTEFYLLGPSGKIEGYPSNLILGESGTVVLGVVNHEYEEVAYTIVIRLDNETIGTIKDITLNHEAGWYQSYAFTPDTTGDGLKLEFLLFREAVDEAYHSLQLWVTVRPRG